MQHYSAEAWQRLGTAVYIERRKQGMSKMKVWAEKVGRTERTLRPLERGQNVGDDTIELIAEALGWPLEYPYSILDGSVSVASPAHAAPLVRPLTDGELIAHVRETRKLSELELAKVLGVGPEIISEWEAGRERVPAAQMTVVRAMLATAESRSQFG